MKSWHLPLIDTPGGTISPVVLESLDDDARAVLIGFEPGQELGDHQVKERAWVVVVDGSVTFRAGETQVEAGVGTLVVFDPHERHSVQSNNGAQILLFLTPWPGEGHYPSD